MSVSALASRMISAVVLAGAALASVGCDSATPPTRPDWVLPVETARVAATWHGPEDMPAIRRVVDEATGQWCIEYDEVSPLKSRTFYTEIDRAGLTGDEQLCFRWKVLGDNSWVQAQVSGYPAQGRAKRNYYLVKRPPVKGRWQEVWLDLNLDDDLGAGVAEASPGKTRVAFSVKLWDMGEVGDPPRVRVRLADIRFVKHPVVLVKDAYGVRNLDADEGVGQVHRLVVRNRSGVPQSVVLGLDPAGLEAFRVRFSERRFDLAPGASREVFAEMTVPRERAEKLPPLYSERAAVFAATTDHPAEPTTAVRGYLVKRLVGAVPPVTGRYPWFRTDAERARVLAARPGATVDKSVEQLLSAPVDPPELRHGYSGAYMDPGPPRKPLRFRGPGKHFSERTGGFVDLSTMPKHVQMAGAYAHHAWLSDAAMKLAEAWWRTGRVEFARKSADILLACARRYPSYDAARPYATGYVSRVGHAVLGECWWFGHLPEAFDLVRASGVLSEAEDREIVEGLMVPAMVVISTHRVAANQQAEENAAYGKAALVARRWDYAAKALDGEYGMRAQWRLDFDADGLTMERELPYHFAAMGPFVSFANCLEAMGVPVYDSRFKRLFDAPIAYDVAGRPGRGGLYADAWRRYRDPAYLPIARRALRPDELPDDMPEATDYRNAVLPAGGYTMLRAGSPSRGLRAASMNWGSPSHRGGNVLLNPLFHWKGHRLNEHVFRIGYGYKQSHFSYTAAAGNAIVKDGKRHSMLRAEQVALLEGPTPAGRWTSPRRRPLYPGVVWSRSVAICGNSMVLLDQVTSDRPGRFDWLTYLPHAITSEQPELEERAYPDLLEQGDGYDYFQDPTRLGRGSRGEVLTFGYPIARKGKPRPMGQVMLLSSAPQLLRARGYIHWHPRLVPVLIQRFDKATSFWSVAVYTGLEADAGKTTGVEKLVVRRDGRPLPETEALAVRVRDVTGDYLVLTSTHDGPHDVAGRRVNGPLAVVTLQE